MNAKKGSLAAKILIVEDESIIAMDIERGLRKLGYAVTGIASKSEEVLERIKQERPDLILMDVQLKSRTDGIETAKIIRQQYNIPVIFLTAYADENTLERAKAAEPLGYLLKPFVEDDLHTAIEVALHKQSTFTAQLSMSQQALAKSEHQLNLFIESVKDYALYMIDPQGYIVSWNIGADRIKGYKQEEVIGKHYSLFFTEDDKRINYPETILKIATKESKFADEGWRVRKDKRIFWESFTVNAILGEKNSLIGFAVVAKDITERKHMIDELHAAIQLREDFLSIASHELKTPVTTLLLQLQGMHRRLQKAVVTPAVDTDAMPTKTLIKNVIICEEQTKKLAKLLEALLDLTRIRVGKINLELQQVNLGELVRDTVAQIGITSVKKSQIIINIEEQIIQQGDRHRLEQVITNLITNAIKYGENKPIKITVKKDLVQQQAVLQVQDFGIGIAPEMQEKIFQRFERAASSRNLGGLGLGLYIVHQIVTAHGGTVAVESELGKGATFIVFLPLQMP